MAERRKINLGIVAHVDAGKTSLTEQLLFFGGALRAAGTVDQGTAQTDTLAVEQARGISVKTADAVLETEDAVINIIDTPGHADFISEVERALSVLDCAVVVVSAVEGVQAQTEILLGAIEKMNLPCVLFINKLDRAGSDFASVYSDLEEQLAGHSLLNIYRPENEGELSVQVARDPDALENAVVLTGDEELVESFLLGEEPDFAQTVRLAVENGAIPVLCGSSKTGVGCRELLNFIRTCMPCARVRERSFAPAFSVWSMTSSSESSATCAFSPDSCSRDRAYICPGWIKKRRSPVSADRSAESRRMCSWPRPVRSPSCSASVRCVQEI